MGQHISKNKRDLLPRLRTILNGQGSPETRIDQALILLNQETDQGESSTQASEVWASFPSLKGPGFSSQSSSSHRKPKPVPAFIGHSPVMQVVHAAIQRISKTSATILLRGESGTGKELAAQWIHRSSTRATQPFVVVHCAAVPEPLIESTLFGHERGAFTGASQTRKGRMEQAHGGTLFLDEVGDIPLATQVKLLRVLQDKEFERVGSGETRAVDVRVIAATHRHLEAMVGAGEFREDLYYRLNVVPLTLPPLRDRGADVPELIQHFLDKFNKDNNRAIRFGKDLLHVMSAYHWPGNIRELQNCIERLVVLADGSFMDVQTVPNSLVPYIDHMREVRSQGPPKTVSPQASQPLPARLDEIERARLREALKKAGWVKAKAARLLGMTPRQIAYRIEKYQLVEEL